MGGLTRFGTTAVGSVDQGRWSNSIFPIMDQHKFWRL